MLDIFNELNNEQTKAVQAVEGPVLVFAGAGTGKTKTLISRIIYMIDECHINPRNILAITFTNKATNEMRTRINSYFTNHHQQNESNGLNISTIHSLCSRILRRYITRLGYERNFEIIDDEESQKVISDLLKKLDFNKKEHSPRAIAKAIGDFKNGLIDLEEQVKEIYDAYQSYLKSNNLVDFDDLLLLAYDLLKNYEEVRNYYQELFEYILVDEFQDTNHIQYEIVKILAAPQNNVFVVGDDDQSIYSFRGACVDNMFDFTKDYHNAQVYKLVENYRSSNGILKGANNLIKNNKIRETKELFSKIEDLHNNIIVKDNGDSEDEINFVVNEIAHLVYQKNYDYHDIAILYRNNVISRGFEMALISAGIPYNIYGGFAYLKRREIKDVLSYLRFIVDPTKEIHFKRIINVPARGIGDKTVQNVLNHSFDHHITIFEAIDEIYEQNPSSKNQALKDFKTLIEDLASKVETMNLQEFLDLVLEKTGYLEMLKEEETFESNRIANVYEFKSILANIDELYTLENLTQREKISIGLDEIVLDQSSTEDSSNNGVVLSTIHSVKGLEFKVVFLVALEEGIFPTTREESDIEEERRVAYVAVTRAKERLYLTSTNSRFIYGKRVRNNKSRFLVEFVINADKLEKVKKADEKKNDGTLKVGDKVVHTVFGYGLVISVDDRFVQILFEKDNTIRKILKDHPTISRV